MDSTLLQNLRYKLQSRVRRVETARHSFFGITFQQFWTWLETQELFSGILARLDAQFPDVEDDVEQVVNNRRHQASALFTGDEHHDTAVCAEICRRLSVADSPRNMMMQFSREFTSSSNFDDLVETFRRVFVEQVYEYLDEAVDDERAILALLRRYKKKCEWFQREHLHTKWEANTQRGEKLLANHLYEYLHDQGLSFRIEERTASGEPDLISIQEYSEGLVADAKIFNPGKSKGRSYIASGFRQLYEYVSDHNQDAGYLIIFNTAKAKLSLNLTDVEFDTPFLRHNGKLLYGIEVDIFPYEKSASKRGQLSRYEVTESDVVEELASSDAQAG